MDALKDIASLALEQPLSLAIPTYRLLKSNQPPGELESKQIAKRLGKLNPANKQHERRASRILKAIISPTRRVPPELLEQIFEAAVQLDREEHGLSDKAHSSLVSISETCCLWNSVARSTPFLWRQLPSADFADLSDTTKVASRVDAAISRYLPLSRNDPIIFRYATSRYTAREPDMQLLSESTLKSLMEVSNRWGYVEIQARFDKLAATLRPIKGNITSLHTLSIAPDPYDNGPISRSPYDVFSDAPKLAEVQYNMPSSSTDPDTQPHCISLLFKLPWTQLTSYSERSSPSNTAFDTMCSSTKKLETLVIRATPVLSLSPTPATPLHPRTVMHSLLSFELEVPMWQAPTFLDSLVCPSLQHLKVAGERRTSRYMSPSTSEKMKGDIDALSSSIYTFLVESDISHCLTTLWLYFGGYQEAEVLYPLLAAAHALVQLDLQLDDLENLGQLTSVLLGTENGSKMSSRPMTTSPLLRFITLHLGDKDPDLVFKVHRQAIFEAVNVACSTRFSQQEQDWGDTDRPALERFGITSCCPSLTNTYWLAFEGLLPSSYIPQMNQEGTEEWLMKSWKMNLWSYVHPLVQNRFHVGHSAYQWAAAGVLPRASKSVAMANIHSTIKQMEKHTVISWKNLLRTQIIELLEAFVHVPPLSMELDARKLAQYQKRTRHIVERWKHLSSDWYRGQSRWARHGEGVLVYRYCSSNAPLPQPPKLCQDSVFSYMS
ncbi:hypothetical protein FA15DRAFT_673198 [Coprinopsis marcescibilis]|uniref:Uncharacterized protein n=1 Tax=Coprinopsis marcescibilis TaxID=230819 RepID=A0A5C3KKP0_COPMA|nr:hypothetical protein FA15DRAFT_673198 [Coprinopsis marcescibilis]